MRPNLLILGGTSEASALAAALAARGDRATLSYAGRIAAPRTQPLPTRTGGFGGVDGLATYLAAHAVTHVIDATHPFAARMSHNAQAACASRGTALAALVRPAWTPEVGDRWQTVADLGAAVRALQGPARRIFLAIGRQHLPVFAEQPQHDYLLRLVDAPTEALPLPRTTVITARGPFDAASDVRLLRDHRIDLIVAKNAGGDGARAKLTAARELGLPVILIERPAMPRRTEVTSVAEALAWLDHVRPADLGV